MATPRGAARHRVVPVRRTGRNEKPFHGTPATSANDAIAAERRTFSESPRNARRGFPLGVPRRNSGGIPAGVVGEARPAGILVWKHSPRDASSRYLEHDKNGGPAACRPFYATLRASSCAFEPRFFSRVPLAINPFRARL